MEYLFTQQITHNENDLELDFLKSCTLTLKINSPAPIVVLRMLNPNNTLLEDLGLIKYDELAVRFMDINSEDDGETMNLVILDIIQDKNPNILILECLEENAYWLLQKNYQIFNKQPVPSILQALVPKLTIDCGDFPAENTYHLPNKRRFDVLARMAKEHGAIFYITRGKLVFKAIDELMKESDIAVYEYHNKAARYQITQARLIENQYQKEESKRHFIGWHIEKGFIESTEDTDYPPQMVSVDTIGKLNNISKKVKPVLGFRALGEGELEPGSMIKCIWHSGIADRPIDESYPDRVMLGEIEHHQGNNFVTSICGVL
jgi:hypothetical protein